MIEKAIAYKKTDKDFISSLKKLGLSENEINFILKKYKRKKFDDGGDSGGDSGGQGDSNGNANDQGGTQGPGQSPGDTPGDTMGSSTAQDQAANQAASQAAQQAASDMATIGMQENPEEQVGIMSIPAIANIISPIQTYLNQTVNPAVTNFVNRGISYAKDTITNAITNAIANPISTIAGAINPVLGLAVNAFGSSNKGITGPNDDTEEQNSVQVSTQNPSNYGGSINTIESYAPLYNTSTGDNTADSMRIRLENLLRPPQPTTYGLPSINPYSNYTLLDLKNLRG